MKLITKAVFTLVLFALIQSISAQDQTVIMDFSDPVVDCTSATVCYDATMTSNGVNFGLANYNLRFFYDASRITYVPNSANTNNLPVQYNINSTQIQLGDLTGFGSLAFEDSLAYLEIGVGYAASTPVPITGIPSTVLQNMCFEIVDASILSDPASCFDLIWATNSTLEGYANGPTSINYDDGNGGAPSIDVLGSTYNDLTSASNCLEFACITDPCNVDADGDGVCDTGNNPDPDPNDPCVPNSNNAACLSSLRVYELDFTNGTLNCTNQTICYDITIEAPEEFDLGSYNLRLFYDGDILDLIDNSPNLSPGSVLDGSYNITSVNDMQGGNMSSSGSLPFDDNLDIIDIAVNYVGGNPIVAGAAPQIITHDLCFDIIDSALIEDPAVCIHAVWITNATEETYTVGETTVNVAGNVGITTDIDNSIYNDLDPNGAQCLENACITAIPTMGEWGLICLALILLIFGVVTIKETVPNLSKA